MKVFEYCLDFEGLYEVWNFDVPDLEDRIAILQGLIERGELIICAEVYREAEKKDEGLYSWLKTLRNYIYPLNSEVEYHLCELLRQHPELVNVDLSRIQSDSFVIATALSAKSSIASPRLERDSLLALYDFKRIAENFGVPIVSVEAIKSLMGAKGEPK